MLAEITRRALATIRRWLTAEGSSVAAPSEQDFLDLAAAAAQEAAELHEKLSQGKLEAVTLELSIQVCKLREALLLAASLNAKK